MKRAITAWFVGSMVAYGGRLSAGPLEVGGWLGPRLFNDNSRLGQRDLETRARLTSALQLGGRVGWPLLRGALVPEFELAFASTQTDPFAVGVLWLEPRIVLRFQFMKDRWIRPFALIGGGAPISLSGNGDVFANQVLGEGFVGGGVTLWTGKGFALRVDARVSLLPGDDPRAAVEGELGVGLLIPLGRRAQNLTSARATADLVDRDNDGIADRKDSCVDRPEDVDGVEDQDGCPDIDNDLDHVLDVADSCALQPETYNGVADDDGCPDTVGPELASIVGRIPRATYLAGAPAPQSSGTAVYAQIAKALLANPTVRIRLIGHTDDHEAVPVSPPAQGDAPDLSILANDLGMTRASVIREFLISRGIVEERIDIDSRGADEPETDNAKPGGRQRNRRVELQLFVPQR
jgi:outer membrane protein OmpA-like peptidoglycan-associated protein